MANMLKMAYSSTPRPRFYIFEVKPWLDPPLKGIYNIMYIFAMAKQGVLFSANRDPWANSMERAC